MNIKTKSFLITICLIFLLFIFLSQFLLSKTVSVTQLGFIIKKSLPQTKTIAVLYPSYLKTTVIKDAKLAYSILRKNIVIYKISRRFELTKKIKRISKYKNVAVVLITDKSLLTQKSVKFISSKLSKLSIPLISNRKDDTKFDALISMFYNKSKKLEIHLNKSQLEALDLTIPDDMVNKFIIDSDSK
jgi:ABC-type uncharacterized transport system substrate-binding protein